MVPAVPTSGVRRTLGNWKLKRNLSLLPLSFILVSDADGLEGWISDTSNRHCATGKGDLFFSSYFTFHSLLLYKNYCFCTLHVNTVPKQWLQPRKYLSRASANLLPIPLLDLKTFSDSPGRKTQVSAGDLQLSQRGIMLFAFRTDFCRLCPSCFDPVTCGCSLTGPVCACLCHTLSGRTCLAQAALSLFFTWQQTGLTWFLSLKWCRAQIPLIHLTRSSLVFSQHQN